ncbi:MAG: glycosyltransferase family 2 protein [Burkholderiales bacterium]|nr:glycosyltransferase family 2 protein [Phycisphaerae bacterium]
MAFHGFMLLRDEEDVIQQNLDHLLTWVDGLYILDLGSTDRTWEIVQDYARREKRIIPFEHAPIVYSDNLRSYMFHHLRNRLRHGDWVLRLDADEFYHVPPPQFVQERMTKHESAVHLQWYFFRLTHQEVADYESGRVDVMADRQRSIIERRRYYKISDYAEPRMFRYRRTMQWPETISFPFNAGYVARERIPILHYPHRDPLQMARRYRLRAEMMKLKAAAGGHWKLDDWRQDVVDDVGGSEAQSRKVGIADSSLVDSGPLLHWTPGTPLTESPRYNHVRPVRQRVATRLLYATGVSLLDLRRPRFDASFKPQYLSEETNALIGRMSAQE